MLLNAKKSRFLAVDPGGHLCEVPLASAKKKAGVPVLKPGWRFATAADVKAKEEAAAKAKAKAAQA